MLSAVPAETGGDIDTFLVIVEMLGGLAIFLLGMDRMTEALRLIAGSRMRDVLAKLTSIVSPAWPPERASRPSSSHRR